MKFRITMSFEYEVHPEFYPEGYTPEQMLEIDRGHFEGDPGRIMDHEDVRVTGEIVK